MDNTPNHTDPKSQETPVRRPSMLSYLFLIGLLVLFTLYSDNYTANQATSWLEVQKTMLPKRAIEKIEVVNGEEARIYIKKKFADTPPFKEVMHAGKSKSVLPGPHYRLTIGSVEAFEQKLAEAQQGVPLDEQAEVIYSKSENWLGNIFIWMFPIMLLLLFWRYMLRNMGGGGGASSIFNFGKSKAILFRGR